MEDALKHGLRGTYVNHGCRCEECREANALYARRFRMKYRPYSYLQHGKNSTYLNYRCRCEDCRAAHRGMA